MSKHVVLGATLAWPEAWSPQESELLSSTTDLVPLGLQATKSHLEHEPRKHNLPEQWRICFLEPIVHLQPALECTLIHHYQHDVMMPVPAGTASMSWRGMKITGWMTFYTLFTSFTSSRLNATLQVAATPTRGIASASLQRVCMSWNTMVACVIKRQG